MLVLSYYKIILELIVTCLPLPGETAVFRYRIDGEPQPTIEWSKGKWRKLTNDAKTRIYFDETTGQHVLEIDDIKEKDAATYTVTICNEHCEIACSATLIVTDKPEEVQDWKAQLKRTYVYIAPIVVY